MGFLKGLGIALSAGQQLMGVNIPFIKQAAQSEKVDRALDNVTNTFDQVAGFVVVAETIGQGMKGPDKLRAASPLVAAAVKASTLMRGKKIKDQAKFDAAMVGITSNMADFLNSIEED